MIIVWLLAVCCAARVSAFLPGLSPVNYCKPLSDSCTDKIHVYVSPLETNSDNLPLGYGHFDFCTSDDSETSNKSAVQILFDRIRPGYDISYLKNEGCKTLCTKTYYPNDTTSTYNLFGLLQGIHLNYYHRFIVDDIPVKWCTDFGNGEEYCNTVFPMGCQKVDAFHDINICNVFLGVNSHALKPNTFYLFNHFEFTITYQSGKNEEWGSSINSEVGRITDIKLKPKSIKHGYPVTSCDSGFMEIPMGNITSEFNITYSYSVKFEMNNTMKWISRWNYISDLKPSISMTFIWFIQFNSYIFFLFIYEMVPLYILYSMHKIRCNKIDTVIKEDQVRWKIMHENVSIMTPKWGMLLSVFTGCGVQVLCMVLVSLGYLYLGFIMTIPFRGIHMIISSIIVVCLGVPGGLVSSRMYNTLGGKKWKTNVILTAISFPGLIFGLFFFVTLIPRIQSSSTAMPFSALLSLCIMWICLTIPFTFIGAVIGLRKIALERCLKTNNRILRKIPGKTLYTKWPLENRGLHRVLLYFSLCILLFCTVDSYWCGKWDYLFLFFLIDLFVLIIYSEPTAVLCYFHLCIEELRVWQRTIQVLSTFYCIMCWHYIRSNMSVPYFFDHLDHPLAPMIVIISLILSGFLVVAWLVRKVFRVEVTYTDIEHQQRKDVYKEK